jgi:hypothetical protein
VRSPTITQIGRWAVRSEIVLGLAVRRAAVIISVVTWVGALAAAGAASALTTAYAADEAGNPTSVDHVTVTIPVTAQVGAACGTTTLPNTTVLLGELSQALTSTQVALTIQCTGAFRMGIVSSNGGLKSAVGAVTGYTNQRDYNVALHIVDNSNTDNVSSTCLASSLTATAPGSICATNLRGPATAATPGFQVASPSTGKSSYLLISDAPLGSNILVSGSDYSDTLTITLTAAT